MYALHVYVLADIHVLRNDDVTVDGGVFVAATVGAFVCYQHEVLLLRFKRYIVASKRVTVQVDGYLAAVNLTSRIRFGMCSE